MGVEGGGFLEEQRSELSPVRWEVVNPTRTLEKNLPRNVEQKRPREEGEHILRNSKGIEMGGWGHDMRGESRAA